MKNKLSLSVLASTLVFVSGAGVAGSEDENYIGIQYGVAGYDERGISETYTPSAFVVRLGQYFNSNFSIEGRLGSGLGDDSHFLPEFGVSGVNVSLELDRIMGVYATGHVDLNESSSVYGLLGVSRVEGTISAQGFPGAKSSNSDESGFSYGVGVDVGVSDTVALNLEYLQYLDKSELDLGVIALGATFSF